MVHSHMTSTAKASSIRHLHTITALTVVLPFLSPVSHDLQDFFLSRPHWLALLCIIRATVIVDWGHNLSSLIWLTMRGIRVRRMEMKVNACQIRGCDLLKLKKTDLTHIGLSDCINITDACILNIVKECCKLISIDLSRCKSLTDAGTSALDHQYGQLQSINLAYCDNVTDIGISA